MGRFYTNNEINEEIYKIGANGIVCWIIIELTKICCLSGSLLTNNKANALNNTIANIKIKEIPITSII